LEEDSDQGFLGLLKFLTRKKIHLADSSDLTQTLFELMKRARAKGFVSELETRMVFGVLHLRQTATRSIMVPRTEISSAPADATLGEIIELVAACGHTRIPIHKESIDQIVGILHAKDLLRLWGRDVESTVPEDILRKPFFVPESEKLSELLRDLKDRKTHLAVVTDEYGGTAGIITIEDIIEEIVGEIMDEHDTEEPMLVVMDDGSLLVDARLEIEKLEERLGRELPKDEYESVGGFILHLLGRIPKEKETLVYDDLEITVQKADPRKVHKVIFSRKPSPPSPEAGEATSA
jgi:magnesium and cobalt transporter